MLGVIKIDEKKVLKTIDEMLADPWQVDIQELFAASFNEPDEIKKNLYDSLYTYVLQKRQEDIMVLVQIFLADLILVYWVPRNEGLRA
ncbi:hypothetical protein Nizo2484_1830 [Lactiplantibacillus plantarum]|nr:hypothetical protein Nizo2484_1830 [Lactiplantibacillus plantarum]KZU23952.1 hypothetical protein Nizo2485_2230 [Lactiplantibacillus plantarum]